MGYPSLRVPSRGGRGGRLAAVAVEFFSLFLRVWTTCLAVMFAVLASLASGVAHINIRHPQL